MRPLAEDKGKTRKKRGTTAEREYREKIEKGTGVTVLATVCSTWNKRKKKEKKKEENED